MMVLVDTPVWSLALRRKQGDLNAQERRIIQALAEFIQEGRAQRRQDLRLLMNGGLLIFSWLVRAEFLAHSGSD